jgi:hypothetical protein
MVLCAKSEEVTNQQSSEASDQESVSTIEAQAKAEITKRQIALRDTEQAFRRGDAAFAEHDYEKAFSEYRAGVERLPAGMLHIRERAIERVNKSAMSLAEQQIAEGKYEEAKTTLAYLLQPRYRPAYEPALKLLERLQTGDNYNTHPAPTPAQEVTNP